MLQFIGLQRVGHHLATEQQQSYKVGGDVLISSSLQPFTDGQSQIVFLCPEQRHFSLTVRQRGRVLGRPLCMIIITKAMKSKG